MPRHSTPPGRSQNKGRKDDAYLALLGDIYAHLGDTTHADADVPQMPSAAIRTTIRTISRSRCCSFAKITLPARSRRCCKGQARVPGSGKILWGLGIVSALEGNTAEAGQQFERAVDLLPEWPGSYSTLGVFYFQTGQIDKAKEVLDRFKNSSAAAPWTSTGLNRSWPGAGRLPGCQ